MVVYSTKMCVKFVKIYPFSSKDFVVVGIQSEVKIVPQNTVVLYSCTHRLCFNF